MSNDPNGSSSKDLPARNSPSPINAPSSPFRSNRHLRPCRNVVTYGFCKYENKGCEYNHDMAKLQQAQMLNPASFSLSEAIQAKPFVPSHEQTNGKRQVLMVRMINQRERTQGYTNGEMTNGLDFHLATTSLPHISKLTHNQKSIHAFFMADKLKEELLKRNANVWYGLGDQELKELGYPSQVHTYHSLTPLAPNDEYSEFFGLSCSTYKAVNSIDGKCFALKRIHNYRLISEAAMSVVESWRRIRHANIISLREAFTTKQFSDNSLVFVYDYHPLATSLHSKYIDKTNELPEKVIWSFVIQIFSALKTIHGAGLACQTIHPSKILITGKHSEPDKDIFKFQQHDYYCIGRSVLQIALHTNNEDKLLEQFTNAGTFSHDLINFVSILMNHSIKKTVDSVLGLIGSRILFEINNAHHYDDYLEAELSKELENGRLVRLLCKLGFLNERPEQELDPLWSETGSGYLIKLFRDYVFHQVDEQGAPVLDMSHVIQCLNKLDAGSHERIMLMSRDETTCLIISFKEMKRIIESCFSELVTHRSTLPMLDFNSDLPK